MLKGPASEVFGDCNMSAMDAIHLSSMERCNRFGTIQRDTVLAGEEEGVKSFFGQLWSVLRPRAVRASQIHPTLFWIRQDLWESKTFGAVDCYLVKHSNVLCLDPKQGTFTADFWACGERRSYSEVVQGGMAGRPNRGRGRGCGAREEE
jgi:hypothetical protein